MALKASAARVAGSVQTPPRLSTKRHSVGVTTVVRSEPTRLRAASMAEPWWRVSWPLTQASSKGAGGELGVEHAGRDQQCAVVVEEAGGGVVHLLPGELFDDDLASRGEQCGGMRQDVVQVLGVVQGTGEQHDVVLARDVVEIGLDDRHAAFAGRGSHLGVAVGAG
ncbi:hypothetical protein QMK34_30615 [Amycolatopsis sp. H20-H5]|nr:hypothetical protein [Amycolatopsis sp. H20-H5]MEC3979617.1 hypothetical protein [Amycolatopsis sp. H20-H5]